MSAQSAFIKQNLYIIWQQLKKGILQIFTANVVNKFVLMLSNMLVTRMLAQYEYGILSYAGNIYSYAALIMGFGLAAGALQFGIENRGSVKENSFYRYCASAGMMANLLIIAVFATVIFWVDLPIRQTKRYIQFYLPLLLIEYFIQLILIILRSQNRFNSYAKLITMHTIFVAGGTCIGAIWGIGGVIAAKYIASLGVLFIMLWQIRENILAIFRAEQLESSEKKQLWHYSIFNGVSSTLNTLLFLIDITMVGILSASAQMVAIYKVATLIPTAIKFIPQSVVICIVPDVVAHNQNVTWLKKALSKVFTNMFIFNLVLSLALIVCAPWIIQLVAGKQYLAAVQPFRILVAGYCVAGTFRSLSVNFLAALKVVKFNAACAFISCAANIIFNLYMIPRFGILGAAYATFSAEVVASVLTFGGLVYALKILNEQNKLRMKE